MVETKGDTNREVGKYLMFAMQTRTKKNPYNWCTYFKLHHYNIINKFDMKEHNK